MKRILTGSSILLLGVGLSIFTSNHVFCQHKSAHPSDEAKTSEKEWIGNWSPSNQKIRVFVDGQHKATIYPDRYKQDRSGNIYIKSDKTEDKKKDTK